MHCTFWLCLYFLLVARATNITTDNPSTTPIPVASSLHFSFPAFSTIHFESGIHPCLDMVNYAFLAIQGHIRRVTHSYKHVSPWVSLLLILSGDISINPGPNHILDVVCVRDTFSRAVCAMVTAGLSDHLAITFLVNILIKAPCKFRQVNTRKIHKINITDFRENILNSDLIKHPHTTASLLSHQYFNTLRNILDKHAQSRGKWLHRTLTKAL